MASVHPNFLRDIPDFLIESVVFSDSLTFKKDEKSCFILAKNLKFYEFRKKQLKNCVDLRESCLSTIEKNIQQYLNDNLSKNCQQQPVASQSRSIVEEPTFITIGKYIYRNFEISKLYLLLQCWDKLIIMEHNDTSGMKLVAEYENVANYKIVPNNLIKYQSELKISFDNGTVTCTDFQENDDNSMDAESSGGNKVTQKNEFKHLLDSVRTTKAELQLHKEITQKQFQNLSNTESFGNNFLRSTKLEEKFMLSKCGDLWIRITATDELVLGLPLVNNCAPPNLTILKNLQPIINFNEAESAKQNNNLHFEHQLYHLRQTFENLETLETLFQSQDVHFQHNKAWEKKETNELQPNAFIVILLKLKLSQLIFINAPCQLFVRFEVIKDLESLEPKTQTFEQHLFVKTLNFQQVLHERSLYEINFEEKTLHQDLLATAVVSFDTRLHIEFAAQCDFEQFERLLATKFDFDVVSRSLQSQSNFNAISMNVDKEICDYSASNSTEALFYNRKPNSLWFGSFVVRHALTNADDFDIDDEEPLPTDWIFYNRNEEKSFIMLKLLFDVLIALKCNIKNIKNAKQQNDPHSNIISFENAIREELNVFYGLNEIVNDPQKFREQYKKLAEHQFYTDIIANEL